MNSGIAEIILKADTQLDQTGCSRVGKELGKGRSGAGNDFKGALLHEVFR